MLPGATLTGPLAATAGSMHSITCSMETTKSGAKVQINALTPAQTTKGGKTGAKACSMQQGIWKADAEGVFLFCCIKIAPCTRHHRNQPSWPPCPPRGSTPQHRRSPLSQSQRILSHPRSEQSAGGEGVIKAQISHRLSIVECKLSHPCKYKEQPSCMYTAAVQQHPRP